VRVKWLRMALANLETEEDYIAEDNPVAARRVYVILENALESGLATEELTVHTSS